MTNKTSHWSFVRIYVTRPAGTFASTYKRGCPAMRPACGPSSEASVPMTRVTPSSMPLQVGHRLDRVDWRLMLAARCACFLLERHDQLVTSVNERFARTPIVIGSNGVLAEQRKSDRRIAVRDHRVRKNARVHFAPAHRFGGRGAGQTAPDDLIGRDLNEIVVTAFGYSVDFPQRRLPL